MRIPEELIEKIKDENDIVDVISENIKLKRSGRNYLGLCPFHNEKSPSFSVSSDKQIYKCFGCGETGNVVTFIMKYRNLSYIESIKYLGERININVDLENKDPRKDRKSRLYEVSIESARYFFNNLQKQKYAKEYVVRRGISETTIRKFGLGFSLNSWDSLLKFLRIRGYKEQDIFDAGLIIKKEKGGFYDRFRNRIIFPVFDYKGKVIGFGGRVLDDSKPKYLNSPETLIFSKGTNLYGLNFAIKNSNTRTFIIVEGYMDCISLHQYGITNVVASLGTALTVNQAKLLKRYADKVIISYDADLAGQMATIRGLEILKNTGFDVRVLTVPQGKDPDEYIRSNGKEAFINLIDKALPLIDYRLTRAKQGIDFNNGEMLIKYTKEVTEILKSLDSVEKDVYIKKISEDTGVKEQALYDLLNNEINKISVNNGMIKNEESYNVKLYVEPAYLKSERSILKLMLSKEDSNLVSKNVNKDDFILDSHKKIYDLIIEYRDKVSEDIYKYIEARCDDVESSKEWISIIELELLDEEVDKQKLIKDYLNNIKKYRLEESKKEIMQKIKEYETKGMIEESVKWAQRLIELQKEIGRC
ncbi:DNA primase [Desnuesiella massiliensis]|uniref:DNA primase n=1 Tax=Desnuesiella massiliensis TaxID=1650662 RepID=UPI0006E1614F|nr:DNA primase [Desnuesiella massiliensis]